MPETMRLAARDRKSTLPDYLIKEPPPLPIALDLVRLSAKLLFANGQTTQKIVLALGQMAGTLGFKLTIYPNWGEVIVRLEDNTRSCSESIAIEPAGVDLSKVSATMGVIFQICEGRIDAAAARMALAEISRAAPVSLVRFALLAAAGAAALGVIFGANHPVTLALIALVAGVGACLRRWLAGLSHNLFVQPFGAALLAGIAGAIAVHLQLSSPLRLVALCPCMILVPGPHILIGAMDVARARIPLGIARLTYASLIILTICTGLILGLTVGGASLPASGVSSPVPLGFDVLAAGVAVAAYGTFFNMSWRTLFIPIVIGMFAHACRWAAITLAGANPASAALIACLLVGFIMTPIADRLRLPFAGLAFSAVVSLLPGAYLFRMAGGMASLVTSAPGAGPELFFQVGADAAVAMLIVVAMTFGLIVPRIWLEDFTHFWPALGGIPKDRKI